MAKSTFPQCNFTLGEISPRVLGRFEQNKPVFSNSAAIIENMLMFQAGSLMLRPGTRYVAAIKDQSNKVRLERFRYSTVQEYIMEMGNIYIRFYANGGQLVSGFTPVEVATPFLQADLFDLQMANKADVMYIVHPNYYPQKLIRTSATSFTISNVPFVRGPFLDDNITATTITSSADTGNGVLLTASSAIFQSDHVGALWRVKGGVVKITSFTSTTIVNGDVQNEPDGTAGNLGTGGSATKDWAEGAFSSVRGFPTAVVFHEQRLLYGGTTFAPQKWYASVIGAYDNYDKGTATDSDAYIYEIASNIVNDIRWMASDVDLKFGTSGGTITAKSQAQTGITPSAPPSVIIDTDYSVMKREPEKIAGAIMYLQANTFQLRQLIFNLAENRDQSEDMTLLADHILRDGQGAVQMARQQSPNDRIWVVRQDGQIAVFTRNAAQQVQGWTRFLTGKKDCSNTDGEFESISILPQDGADDQIWVVVKRNFQGTIKRYVEYFTPELFDNDWEPIRLDCSLSLNNPVTITGMSQGNPILVNAPSHGFSNGDKIKIDNVIGMTQVNGKSYLANNVTTNTFELQFDDATNVDGSGYCPYISGGQVRKKVTSISGLNHLEGQTVSAQTDGSIPSAQQTFTVSSGTITLVNPAAVVHVGLPFKGKLQFLPLGDGANGTGQTKSRKLFKVVFRLWKSLGGMFGKTEDNLYPIIPDTQNANVIPGDPVTLFTGDQEIDFESSYDKYWSPVLTLSEPLPFMLLAVIFTSDVTDDK